MKPYVSLRNKGDFYLIELVQGIYIEVNKMRKECGQKTHWMAQDPITGADCGHGYTRHGCIIDAWNVLGLKEGAK